MHVSLISCASSPTYKTTYTAGILCLSTGSFAPFEVDFELWAGEKCNEFVVRHTAAVCSYCSHLYKEP